MKVDLTGAPEIRAAFAALVPRVREKALAQLATAVHREVMDGADRHTKTGALFQSARLARTDDGWRVYHDLQRAPHAPFVHWGTKPHVIRPKDRKALRYTREGVFWFWFGPKSPRERAMIRQWVKNKGYDGNTRILFKWPFHPGYKGDDYMRRAVDNAVTTFERIVHETLSKTPGTA